MVAVQSMSPERRKLLQAIAWVVRLLVVIVALAKSLTGDVDGAIFMVLLAVYFQLGDGGNSG